MKTDYAKDTGDMECLCEGLKIIVPGATIIQYLGLGLQKEIFRITSLSKNRLINVIFTVYFAYHFHIIVK